MNAMLLNLDRMEQNFETELVGFLKIFSINFIKTL